MAGVTPKRGGRTQWYTIGSQDPRGRFSPIPQYLRDNMVEMQRRRDARYGDDLPSVIMQGEVNDQPLCDELIIGYAFLMMLAWMDITSGLAGNALVVLDERRGLRPQLIDDPALMLSGTVEIPTA